MARGEDAGARLPWVRLLTLRPVWGVILGRFFTDCVWWFYVYWLPKYLSDVRGFSLAAIGASASLGNEVALYIQRHSVN